MKILNFGSLNIDYTYEVKSFVKAGETISSYGMQQFSGGKGLNQSIALSRSGADVWHAGSVGSKEGEFLIQELEQAGVHVEFIKKISERTGHAIIQKDLSGQNCIVLYGGANQSITKEQVDEVMKHFEKGDFLILQNEINEIAYIMEAAHQKGMCVVMNPSPMNEKINEYPLEYVDYFILNEIEATEICTGYNEGEDLIERLRRRFPGAKIVLTLGERGSIYHDTIQTEHQNIYPVDVVDTTAAGDTFTGYFIGALSHGMSVKNALDLAAKASAISVTRKGAAPSIPCLAEVTGCSLF